MPSDLSFNSIGTSEYLSITRIAHSRIVRFSGEVAGCGYFESKESIATWVKNSLQEQMEKDEAYKGLSLGDVVLVRESYSKLTGYVEFKYGVEIEKGNLSVVLDGQQKLYTVEPPRSLILKRSIASLTNAFTAQQRMASEPACEAPTGMLKDTALKIYECYQENSPGWFIVTPGKDANDEEVCVDKKDIKFGCTVIRRIPKDTKVWIAGFTRDQADNLVAILSDRVWGKGYMSAFVIPAETRRRTEQQ